MRLCNGGIPLGSLKTTVCFDLFGTVHSQLSLALPQSSKMGWSTQSMSYAIYLQRAVSGRMQINTLRYSEQTASSAALCATKF